MNGEENVFPLISEVWHIYVRRGRVYHQMNGERLIEESREIVDEKMQEWIF
jgi:hypothetical protein